MSKPYCLKSGNIKSVKITLCSDSEGEMTIYVNNAAVTAVDGVFTINATSLTIAHTGDSKQVRIDKIEIDLA